MKKVKNNIVTVFYTVLAIFGVFIFCFSYFSPAGVCLKVDAKVTSYDKKHFTLNVLPKNASKKERNKTGQKIKIIRSTLSKNLDKFLKMNVGNVVNECFEANNIKKPKKK